MKNIITYGTFDILHPGHIYLFKKARCLGDYLIVGLSTDEFAKEKGKKTVLNYLERKTLIESIKYVDKVIPEKSESQKLRDVGRYKIDTFVMGDDWKKLPKYREPRIAMGKLCKVKFIKRKGDHSSTKIRKIVESYSKSTNQ